VSTRCPQCGADVEAGRPCPACLLALALADSSVTRASAIDDPGTDTSPRTVEGGRPDRVGPYRIVRTLGEGGMGVVYLAEQTEPIRRTVALKVIKIGMDTRAVVSRFEAERQTLALMDHPNIARVIDAGATPDGRPFFVMEHVAGPPITAYCDAHRLSTRARLALLAQVCGAMQHAHQKGIVHRDLKPSNVLVAEQDGVPVPKVIDFGIAKATEQALVEQATFTEQGQFIGTPEYMSPEQTGISGMDVDATTDIYSLGVLLYELLAGALPFEPASLRRAGYAEMQRIICEDEPPRPSTRVSTLGASATEVAARRQTDHGSLRKALTGDLDWITLKAMEKDRARRYASASELAADLARYLADEPVLASPPSAAYRAQKFVRRNRLAVTAASLVALAVIGGLIVSSVLYVREGRARRDADTQRTTAERMRGEADTQRTRAESEANTARLATRDANTQRLEAVALAYAAIIAAADLDIRAGNLVGARDRLAAAAPEQREWEWHYLSHQAELPSPRFDRPLQSTESDGTFRNLFMLSSDELHGYADLFAFSPDGRELIVSNQTSVTRWDWQAKRRIRTDQPFRWVLALSRDGLLVADKAQDGTSVSLSKLVEVYRAAGRERRHTLSGHDSDVTVATFAPDGSRLAVGTAQGSLYLWSLTDGQLIDRVSGDGQPVRDVAFSPQGERLAVATSRSVRILDSQRVVLRTIDEGAVLVRWGPNGGRLFLAVADAASIITSSSTDAQDKVWFDLSSRYGGQGSQSRTVRVRNAATGEQVSVLPMNGQVLSISPSRDGTLVAITTVRGSRTWVSMSETASGAFIVSRPVMDGVDSFAFSQTAFTLDGTGLLTSDGGPVTSWPLGLVGPMVRPNGPGVLAVSRDGRLLASGHGDGTIHLRQVPGGREIAVFRGHTKAVSDVVFAAGDRVVSSSTDGTIRIWDADRPENVRVIPEPDLTPGVLAVSRDGHLLASVVRQRRVTIRDIRSGRELEHIDCPFDVSAVAFAVGGTRIIVGAGQPRSSAGGAAKTPKPVAKIWDRREGRFVADATAGKDEWVEALAVSGDESQIVLVGSGGISTWSSDFSSRRHTAQDLRGNFFSNLDVLFTPDGRRVLTRDTSSGDVSVRDALTGRLLLTIEAEARDWALAPDGTYFVIVDRRGYFKVLDTR
jgi:serine/threonine protein kinase/WD40 repeat protein